MRTFLASDVLTHPLCENAEGNQFHFEMGNTDRQTQTHTYAPHRGRAKRFRVGQQGPCLQVLEATFTLRPSRNGGGDRPAEVKMVTQQYSVALATLHGLVGETGILRVGLPALGRSRDIT